jgi:CBS domain-containing protein
MSGDRLVGLIGLNELRRVGRSAWRTTQAAVAMTPADLLPPVAPGDGLQGAAALLQAARVVGLPVIEDGELVGVLTRHGIARVVRERSAPAKARP